MKVFDDSKLDNFEIKVEHRFKEFEQQIEYQGKAKEARNENCTRETTLNLPPEKISENNKVSTKSFSDTLKGVDQQHQWSTVPHKT